MTKEYILDKIKELKPFYEKEGLILLGLFGSYANNEANEKSDIDILYEIKIEKFSEKDPGFTAFSRLKNIKDELKEVFKTEIDLCAKNGLSRTGEKYILGNVIYV